MQQGSVSWMSRSIRAALRDIAATTHADPTYVVDGIIHYWRGEHAGAVPLTSRPCLNANTAVRPWR